MKFGAAARAASSLVEAVALGGRAAGCGGRPADPRVRYQTEAARSAIIAPGNSWTNPSPSSISSRESQPRLTGQV